jgi:hypothetical protein
MNLYAANTSEFLRPMTEAEQALYESLLPLLGDTGFVQGETFGYDFTVYGY